MNRFGVWIVLALFSVLRILYWIDTGLLHQEAYYWLYSRKLDWCYLDHPPGVAWLIWLGTLVAGHTEIGVRIGAFGMWFVTALFLGRWANRYWGKETALLTWVFLGALPFFFGVGFLMLPDAPLTAAWAGFLWFSALALLEERRSAWLGVGVCLGLGMLSKFTMGLLVPATVVFCLLDPSSRKWFRHPEPYGALGIAAVLFSPVIYWNSTHGWVSFAFQTSQRIADEKEFNTHLLLLSVIALLTPVAVWQGGRLLYRGKEAVTGIVRAESGRLGLFILVYLFVPFSVFFFFSLTHEIKIQWTGPLWLTALPVLAAELQVRRRLQWAWGITFGALLLVYGSGLILLRDPAIMAPLPISPELPTYWKPLADEVMRIEHSLEKATGRQVLIAGADKNKLSSVFAFYDPDEDGITEVSGRHLWGEQALMFERWSPIRSAEGKDVIVIATDDDLEDLTDPEMEVRFREMGEVHEIPILMGEKTVERFYYRVGYDYSTEPAPENLEEPDPRLDE